MSHDDRRLWRRKDPMIIGAAVLDGIAHLLAASPTLLWRQRSAKDARNATHQMELNLYRDCRLTTDWPPVPSGPTPPIRRQSGIEARHRCASLRVRFRVSGLGFNDIELLAAEFMMTFH